MSAGHTARLNHQGIITVCVITHDSEARTLRWRKCHLIPHMVYTHLCTCGQDPHTRQSALPRCLHSKHAQGWRGKSGKHFFQHKQKNTSRACCYCAVSGRCFVCSDNSRTFKWRPWSGPETRAHHWRWGEKVWRPPSVSVCVDIQCVCVCAFCGRHAIVDPMITGSGCRLGCVC